MKEIQIQLQNNLLPFPENYCSNGNSNNRIFLQDSRVSFNNYRHFLKVTFREAYKRAADQNLESLEKIWSHLFLCTNCKISILSCSPSLFDLKTSQNHLLLI